MMAMCSIPKGVRLLLLTLSTCRPCCCSAMPTAMCRRPTSCRGGGGGGGMVRIVVLGQHKLRTDQKLFVSQAHALVCACVCVCVCVCVCACMCVLEPTCMLLSLMSSTLRVWLVRRIPPRFCASSGRKELLAR